MSDEKFLMRKEILRQIGAGTILSISGGRVQPIHDGIELPVGSGYSVRVEYDEGWDDYTVKRMFRRGGKEWVKGQAEHVYCDQLSQMAYRAGMFRSFNEYEWPVAG